MCPPYRMSGSQRLLGRRWEPLPSSYLGRTFPRMHRRQHRGWRPWGSAAGGTLGAERGAAPSSQNLLDAPMPSHGLGHSQCRPGDHPGSTWGSAREGGAPPSPGAGGRATAPHQCGTWPDAVPGGHVLPALWPKIVLHVICCCFFKKKKKKTKQNKKKTPLLGTIESTKHLERDFASLRVKGNYC